MKTEIPLPAKSANVYEAEYEGAVLVTIEADGEFVMSMSPKGALRLARALTASAKSAKSR